MTGGDDHLEVNSPRRALPAGQPPELLLAMVLLGLAGLFTGVPVLRTLPDALELVTDGGVWDSIGPLVLVLLVELGLTAAACIILAWLLSQGDPVARVIAVVVSGSLAFALLAGDVLDGTSAAVTLVCSVAAVLCLTVVPRVREHFAGRPSPTAAPAPVVAAEAMVVMLAGLLLAAGIAYLPLAPTKLKFAVVGLVLIGISVACIKARRRLPMADRAARTVVSGLMAGYVAAILLGRDGAFTGPLLIPLGGAVAVVALLWLPKASQDHFGRGAAPGRPRLARPDRPPLPHPDARQPPDMAAGRAADVVPAPPPPFTPEPIGAPVATVVSPSRPSRGEPPPSAPLRRSAPATAAPTPPPWLLEAPPAGFWPAERRRAEPRQYEVVDLGPFSPDEIRAAPVLGIRFDTTSWFPALEGREQVRGAYLVSIVMSDDTAATAFRGTSTLLVTSTRLLGVCPRGRSADGPLDGSAGRVAVWSVLLDQLDWVQAEDSADGGHITLQGWDADAPWAVLAKPREATDGAFRPSRVADLADVVNRAKRPPA